MMSHSYIEVYSRIIERFAYNLYKRYKKNPRLEYKYQVNNTLNLVRNTIF